MTATNTVPRVWIGCLASYNAGRLIGEWVDAVDADEMHEAQKRVAAEAVKAAKAAKEYPVYFGDPEEFYIGDYDEFGDLASTLGEYPNYETVAKIGELIEDHGAAFIGAVSALEVDLDDVDEDWFYSHSRGEHESEEEYAWEYIKEVGWSNVPAVLYTSPFDPDKRINVFDELSSYLDMESIASELFQHGNFASRPNPSGGVFVYEQEC